MVAELETSIWQRLIEPSWNDLSPEEANGILRLKFGPADIDEMNRLAALAREGALTTAENEELETYMRIGRMVAILQAKARLALKTPPGR